MVRPFFGMLFGLSGWKFVDRTPKTVRSFVLIGAPHTSNHDFLAAMSFSHFLKRNSKFVIKKEWLRFPMNLIMKPLGAIGIDRNKVRTDKHENMTDVMAKLFKKYDSLVLMITPEATRSANPNWKTGFYYVAQKAGVPIALGYADYAKKEAGIGKLIYPSDFEKDMKEIMEFYKDVKGKKPENFKLDPRYT